MPFPGVTSRRVAAAAVLVAAVLSRQASADEFCPPKGRFAPPPVVTFSALLGETVYIPDTTIRGLAHLSQAKGDGTTLGLTRQTTEFRANMRIWSFDMGGGRRCIGLARAEGIWQMSPQVVDIAREYPAGGCNYRIIRDHENRHVAINAEGFRRWSPRAEAEFRAAAGRVEPVLTTDDPARVEARFRQALQKAMEPSFAAFRAELTRRHGAIDTPEAYRQTQALCPRW